MASSSANPTTSPALTEQRKEFDALVRRLNVDVETQKSAWSLLTAYHNQEAATTPASVEELKVWPVCAIYLISCKALPSHSSSVSCISLSQLLRHANLKIMDFFEPMEHFISTLFKDDKDSRKSCQSAAEFLQSKFLIVTLLFKKYEKLYDEYLLRTSSVAWGRGAGTDHEGGNGAQPSHTAATTTTQTAPLRSSSKKRGGGSSSATTSGAAASNSNNGVEGGDGHTSSASVELSKNKLFQVGWLLFLVARSKLLNTNPPDYVKSIYLLLCCVDLMLLHAPSHARKLSLEQLLGSGAAAENASGSGAEEGKGGAEPTASATSAAPTTGRTTTTRGQRQQQRNTRSEKAGGDSPLGLANPPTFGAADTSSGTTAASSSLSGPRETLRALCHNKQDLPYAQVKDFQQRVFVPFLSNLLSSSILQPASPAASSSSPSSTTLHLPGFLDQYLDHNLKALEREYELMHFGGCDFDERLFLSYHPQVQTPSRTSMGSGAATSGSGYGGATPSRYGAMPPPASPALSTPGTAPVPLTPARATLSAVHWLQQVLADGDSSSGDGVPPHIHELLTSLATKGTAAEAGFVESVEKSISQRVHEVASRVDFPTDNSTRRRYVVQLYYRLLGAILAAEERRVAATTATAASDAETSASTSTSSNLQQLLSGLLVHDGFHRSLLAVSLEIVLACHNVLALPPGWEFPYSATLAGVKPFEVGKIIETVIRHEPTDIPRVVLKHLTRIEERILESLSWEDGSPLYDAFTDSGRAELLARLRDTTTTATATAAVPAAPSASQPLMSPCRTFSSPAKRPRPGQQSAATPTSATPTATGTSSSISSTNNNLSRSLELFFRKVAHLGSLRIRKLCRDLTHEQTFTISEKLLNQIEYAFLYIVTQTTLLRNRHIDQIIMCVLYALAKVMLPNKITFKSIIEKYHYQPQAKDSVYRYVRINGQEEADIIQFYNKVLLPAVEPFLLEFQATPAAAISGSDSRTRAVAMNMGSDNRPADLSDIPAGLSTQHLQVFSPMPKQPRRQAQQHHQQFLAAQQPGGRQQERASPSARGNIPNLHISPMRHSATPLLLHHRPSGGSTAGKPASISYQFGLSPHKQIDDINKSVNRETARKKLDFGAASAALSSSSAGAAAPAANLLQVESRATSKSSAKRKLDMTLSDPSDAAHSSSSSSPAKRPKPSPF